MPEFLQEKITSAKVDLSYLEEIAGGSNDFIIEMIDMFLNQTPGYLNDIKKGIVEKNWKTVSEIAHKIKPTLAFMGSDSARETMALIEFNSKNLVELNKIESIFDDLHVFCLQLCENLKVTKEQLPKD
ncbi:MAG: Hpt domain-containing protein [Flavobacterium sp.]|nr:Hpt domain-containing protein [Pedobacter sp.]